MKKKILLIPLVILLLFAIVAPALAQKELVGVQVGDWFKYEAKVTQWVSTMTFLPDGYIGPLTLADNETNYIMYNVTGIVNDVINFTATYNWKNGTETTETMVESVSNATEGQEGHWIPMIGADMNAGEVVSDAHDFLGWGLWDYPQRYINRTFDFVNPNATRATNECNYTWQVPGRDDFYTITQWWDKATGVCVYYENQGNLQELGSTAANNYTFVNKLVDSSVNDLLYIPESFTIAVVVLLSAASVAVSYWLLRKRPKLKNSLLEKP